MLGLVVLFVIGVYLAVSALVVLLAARWAKKRGRRGWVWGGLAALAMYNLVFWDLIPTLTMHKYYCATEAGFWVYKTPEQWVREHHSELEGITQANQLWATEYLATWKREHPGSSTKWVEEGLRSNRQSRSSYKINDGYVVVMDERFQTETTSKRPFSLLSTTMGNETVSDRITGEILAKQVYVTSGYGSFGVGNDWRSMKFWLSLPPCHRNAEQFANFLISVKSIGTAK
jgi:hypothetical protein